MSRLTRVLPILLLGALCGTPRTGYTQVFPDGNGIALAGVKSFDARVLVLTWMGVEEDQERFRTNAQSDFELGLRRDGVIVNEGAPNYLLCELKVAESSGTVAYSWGLAFYEYDFTLDGVHKLLWTTGGIVTVGKNNFSPETSVEECVDRFANEWLTHNPR